MFLINPFWFLPTHDALVAETGVFVLNGQDLQFPHGNAVQAETGVFILNGIDITAAASLHVAYLVAEPATFILNGLDIAFGKKSLIAETGVFILNGNDIASQHKVTFDTVAFILNGIATPLNYPHHMAAGTASFIVSGKPVAMVYGEPYFDKVVLLVDFEGANNATSAIDISDYHHTVRFHGTAKISNALAPPWGTTSLALTANKNNYLSVLDHIVWTFGSGDFTVEMVVSMANVALESALVDQWTRNGSKGWALEFNAAAGTDNWYWSTNGTTTGGPINGTGFAPANDSFHHIAVSKIAGVVYMMADGEFLDSAANAVTYFNSDGELRIGSMRLGNKTFGGNVKTIRITKGFGRYSGASYTAPAGPFPTARAGSVAPTPAVGEFILTGNDVNLNRSNQIMAAAGTSFTLTGNDLIFRVKMPAATASFALNASATALTPGLSTGFATTSFALTGSDTLLKVTMPAALATFTLTGNGTALTYTHVGAFAMAASVATFTMTGVAMTPKVTMPATVAAFTLTGVDALLHPGKAMVADTATFALTGVAANPAVTMPAGTKALTLTGNAVTLTYAQPPMLFSYEGEAHDASNLTTYTFTSKNVGAAGAGRVIALAVQTRPSSIGTPRSISSVTADGNAMTAGPSYTGGAAGNPTIAWFYLPIASGTTVTFVVTFNAGSQNCAIATYRLFPVSSTPVDTAVTALTTTTATLTDLEVKTTGLALILVDTGRSGAPNLDSYSWTGNDTPVQDLTNQQNDQSGVLNLFSISTTENNATRDFSGTASGDSVVIAGISFQ